MKIKQEKILVIAPKDVTVLVERALKTFPDLAMEILDSQKDANISVLDPDVVLVIIDDAIISMDPYDIARSLLSGPKAENIPMLFITSQKAIQKNQFEDFNQFLVDYIVKPLHLHLLTAKIKLFWDLHNKKIAVDQSIEELDKVYKRVIKQHELVIKQESLRKELIRFSSTSANLMQEPLRNLQGNVYKLQKTLSSRPGTRYHIACIKTAIDNLSLVSKKLQSIPRKSVKLLSDNMSGINPAQRYRILYVEDSNEYFSILENALKNIIVCDLLQARTINGAYNSIAQSLFDIIFLDFKLNDGSGFDLLIKLTGMHLDIPIIFVTDKPNENLGVKAIANGAFDYLLKEEISHSSLLSLISSTLQKVGIIREVESAQNRIAMIARKDELTKLFNRRCFEDEIHTETAKSKRYNHPLSILMIDFDHFKKLNQTYGYDTGDAVLRKSAAIIQTFVRGTDKVCRYSGEEFVIILPNTSLDGAQILAERIKDSIGHHEFKYDSKTLNLTISIGISSYLSNDGKLNTGFIKQALDALTSATQEGGNRVKTTID
ncbi:MAG: GGDEF domain-containing response regulator [Desulfobacteraceae bacterium]|nr:GGDEF domain-containing response regulator [Desulfobacteraceae bacterium]